MEIKNLENIGLARLTETINKTYGDYIIQLQLTQQQVEKRNIALAVEPRLSAGVFDKGEFVGFLLHGIGSWGGQKALYNAMTGLLPAYRGKKLTLKMYEYLMPAIKESGAQKIILEFIDGNDRAFKAYKSAGFEKSRGFIGMKGEIGPLKTNTDFIVKEVDNYDWQKLKSFWQWQPSWQNHIQAAENSKPDNVLLCAYAGNAPAAYAILTPAANRVMQFATAKEYRGRGAASALFKHIADNYCKEITIINIDDRAKDISGFLARAGLKKNISLTEMQLLLQ